MGEQMTLVDVARFLLNYDKSVTDLVRRCQQLEQELADAKDMIEVLKANEVEE